MFLLVKSSETLGVLDLQPADWTWTAESQFKGFLPASQFTQDYFHLWVFFSGHFIVGKRQCDSSLYKSLRIITDMASSDRIKITEDVKLIPSE